MACSKTERIIALKDSLVSKGMSRTDAIVVSTRVIDTESNFQLIKKDEPVNPDNSNIGSLDIDVINSVVASYNSSDKPSGYRLWKSFPSETIDAMSSYDKRYVTNIANNKKPKVSDNVNFKLVNDAIYNLSIDIESIGEFPVHSNTSSKTLQAKESSELTSSYEELTNEDNHAPTANDIKDIIKKEYDGNSEALNRRSIFKNLIKYINDNVLKTKYKRSFLDLVSVSPEKIHSALKDEYDFADISESVDIHDIVSSIFGSSTKRVASKYLSKKYGYPSKSELDKFNAINMSMPRMSDLNISESEKINNVLYYIDIENRINKSISMFVNDNYKKLYKNNDSKKKLAYININDFIKSSKLSLGSSANRDFSGEEYVNEPISVDKILEIMKEEVMAENNDEPYSQEYINHVITIDNDISSAFNELDPDREIWTSINETDGKDDQFTSGSFEFDEFTDDNDKISILWNSTSRVAKASEVLLHETIHALLKGEMNRNGKLRNRAKILRKRTRDALLSHDTTYQVFLNGIVDPTDLEIAEAKEKYKYVFSEESNPEEFLAYFLSNPRVFQSVKNLSISKTTENIADPVNDNFMTMAKKIFNTVLNAIIKGRDPEGKVNDLVYDVFADLTKAKLKYEASVGLTGAEKLSKAIPVLSVPVMFSEKLLNKLVGLVATPGSKAYNKLKNKIIVLFNNIIEKSKTSKTFNGFISSIMDVEFISKLLKTEVVNNLFAQGFLTESHSSEKKVRQLIRSQEKIKELELQMRNSIAKDFKTVFAGKDGKKKAAAIKSAIDSGIFQFGENIDAERFNRFNIGSDYEFDKGEVLAFASQEKVDKIEQLARFIRTRKVDSSGLQLNIESILGTASPKELAKGRDFLVSSILNMNTDNENHTLSLIVEDDDLMNVLREYRVLREKKVVAMSKDNNGKNFVDIPFFERINNSNSEKRAIHIGTKKEAEAVGSKIISAEPIMTIDGEDYYRYTTLNVSPSKEAGALDSTDKNIDGYKLSTLLTKHFSRNKKLSAKEKSRLIDEAIANAESNNDIDMSKLVAINDSTGKPVDYIFPFDKNDVYNNIGSSVDPINNLVDLFYRLNHDANVHDGRTALLDELADMNIKPTNGTIQLGSIEGINVPVEYQAVHVPRYMALQLSGSRRASLNNLKIFEKTLFGDIIPPSGFNTFIDFAEKSLEEMFQKYKSVLTLFNPEIAIGNFMSNMLLALQNGIGPIEYRKQFSQKWSSLDSFHKSMEAFTDAKTKYYKTLSKDDFALMEIAENTLMQSEYYNLYAAGHIGGIQDDYESDRSSVLLSPLKNKANVNFTNKTPIEKSRDLFDIETRISAELNLPIDSDTVRTRARSEYRKMIKVPTVVSDVFDVLYTQPTSSIGKFAEKFLLYGDIVAKQIILEKKMKTNPKQDIKQVISELSDLFVDYSAPAGSIQGYFEKVWGVLFMKYLFRSLKGYIVHANNMKKNVALTHTGEFVAGVNLSDPSDSVFNQGLIDAVVNRTKIDNMDSVSERIAIPHITEMFNVSDNPFWKSF